jgi:hypothetical protein
MSSISEPLLARLRTVLGKDYAAQDCSLARALEVIGERWTLLSLRDAIAAGSIEHQRSARTSPRRPCGRGWCLSVRRARRGSLGLARGPSGWPRIVNATSDEVGGSDGTVPSTGSTNALLGLDRCNTDGVPTDIYFAGENVRVKVEEDPSQVAEAFASADGFPFRLTGLDRGEVYINPAMVAFWSASDSSPEPPQDSPPPTSERPAVTDIWGKPLRKKRPR